MMAFIWVVMVATAILRYSLDNRDLMTFPPLRAQSLACTDAPIAMPQSCNTTCSSQYSLQVYCSHTRMIQSVMSKTSIKLQYIANHK